MIKIELLKKLVPLDTLTESALIELAHQAEILRPGAGTTLFEAGDKDPHTYYLIEGMVTLVPRDGGDERAIKGGSESSRYALSQLKPRQMSGRTTSNAILLRFDDELIDRLMAIVEVGGMEVAELGAGMDAGWVMSLLQRDTFEKLPAAHIGVMLERLQAVPVKAGEVIIREGEPGEHYFLIQEGKCVITSGGREVIRLGPGEQFGEEALLSGKPRNATVSMASNGVLLRLSRKDFTALLTAPLIERVTPREAERLLASGAGLLDVRTEAEFVRGTLKRAISFPLKGLREHIGSLDHGRRYIVCCDTGRRSAAAVFMLNQRGIDAVALEGGLLGLKTRARAETS